MEAAPRLGPGLHLDVDLDVDMELGRGRRRVVAGGVGARVGRAGRLCCGTFRGCVGERVRRGEGGAASSFGRGGGWVWVLVSSYKGYPEKYVPKPHLQHRIAFYVGSDEVSDGQQALAQDLRVGLDLAVLGRLGVRFERRGAQFPHVDGDGLEEGRSDGVVDGVAGGLDGAHGDSEEVIGTLFGIAVEVEGSECGCAVAVAIAVAVVGSAAVWR